MITDWDDAYSNTSHIPGGAAQFEVWPGDAAKFRNELPLGVTATLNLPYGDLDRQKLDLFLPAGPPRGLSIFVHGGYWIRFNKDFWSHFAMGALANGWAVVMPGYTLAPHATISQMTAEISAAVENAATLVAGPITLSGHSAGGHLAARQICSDSRLSLQTLSRLTRVVSISGLHDLRPLLKTQMNDSLKLTEDTARAESPALLRPLLDVPVTCWAGADERPEFMRQNDLLANIWRGLGADTTSHHAKNKHHFNVIDDLLNADSELTNLIASPA
jgi:arylformamidase